jgi:hypothetical protein
MLCRLATSVDFGDPERLLQGGEFAWLKDRSWLPTTVILRNSGSEVEGARK